MMARTRRAVLAALLVDRRILPSRTEAKSPTSSSIQIQPEPLTLVCPG
jgi:hypothetical protein